jgi:hypothetical protein
MQTIRHCLTTTIGALLFAGAANAATISDLYSFGSVGTPLDSGVSFNGTLDFFDTAQGTLTNVEMKLTTTSVGGSIVGQTATGAPDATVNITTTMTVVLVNPIPPQMLNSSYALIPSLATTSTITGVFVPGNGGSSDSVTFSNATNSTGWVSVNPVFLDTFKKTSSTTFAITPSNPGGTSYVATGGSVEKFTYTSSDYYGTVEVRYTFTPIPEPSAALLGGLGALMLLRRRR